ncbi:hypothetical protein CASFOL_000268 [Castilleja foliolosa]|uniref:Replication factor A C-terminal domain-containing protein n=1 Tax=Castilleja foliolosa TaxID=1961234 RepID=A0ABD3ENQ8_9LAMI
MDPLILPVLKVDTLFTVNEESEFWMCAIIVNVIGDWWYHACSICDSHMVQKGLVFECPTCQQIFDDGILRYKLQLEVIDTSANASIVLYDQVAENLERKEFQDFPDQLEMLIDRTLLFRVTVMNHQIHKENSVFNVSNFEDNPTLISQHDRFTRERERG